jgi:hypothetical protein
MAIHHSPTGTIIEVDSVIEPSTFPLFTSNMEDNMTGAAFVVPQSLSIDAPFRFLELPPELRCMAYEQVKFASTYHVLTRSEAKLLHRYRPAPRKAVSESSIVAMMPQVLVGLLLTCHLVHQEAQLILSRRRQLYLRSAPALCHGLLRHRSYAKTLGST